MVMASNDTSTFVAEVRFECVSDDAKPVTFKVDGQRFKSSTRTVKFCTESTYRVTVITRPTSIQFNNLMVGGCQLNLTSPSKGRYESEWSTSGFKTSTKGNRDDVVLSMLFMSILFNGGRSKAVKVLSRSSSLDSFLLSKLPKKKMQQYFASSSSVSSSYIEKTAYKNRRRSPSTGRPMIREWRKFQNPSPSNGSNSDHVLKNFDRADDFAFIVCSYNVLCQDTLYDTRYLYKTCAEEWLQWDYRFERIAKAITNINADVYCLQEVQEDHNESHFKPLMKNLGFEGLFKKRTGSKPDGCAIFWRKAKFVVESVDCVEFQIRDTILDRDNVGIVVRLAPICSKDQFYNQATSTSSKASSPWSSKTLVVANTHLLFNPARGDIKLCQLAIFLARIKKLARRNQTSFYPVIICGDFNALPYSPLYNLIITGELKYDQMPRGDVTGQNKKGGPPLASPLMPLATGVSETCEYLEQCSSLSDELMTTINSDGYLRHKLNLRSAYDHMTKYNTFEVTTFHDADAANVDYIFYSPCNVYDAEPKTSNLCLTCRGRLTLPDRIGLERTTGTLPNRTCGSDHIPLAAEFVLSHGKRKQNKY